MLEIRWHARGGQGAKTASHVLALAALGEGFFVQAFPEYGPERSGAPMRVFNRVDARKIRLHHGIEEPDVVAVVDDSLLYSEGVELTEGLKEEGVLLVNGRLSPEEVRRQTGFAGKIVVVDASGIAKETGCRFANVPMLGAIARIVGLPLEAVKRELAAELGKKLPEEALRANLRALEEGYAAADSRYEGEPLLKGVHAEAEARA